MIYGVQGQNPGAWVLEGAWFGVRCGSVIWSRGSTPPGRGVCIAYWFGLKCPCLNYSQQT